MKIWLLDIGMNWIDYWLFHKVRGQCTCDHTVIRTERPERDKRKIRLFDPNITGS